MGVSALAATLAPFLREPLRVRDQRVDLLVGPRVAHGGHVAAALAQQRLEALSVAEQRVPADRRSDELLVEAVALLADAVPLLLAEGDAGRLLCPPLDPALELGARKDLHVAVHERVLDAAELAAAVLVAPGRRLEPRLVDRPRDGVELGAQLRDPPAVDDAVLRRRDSLAHDRVGRRAQVVDRDRAVRVAEEPVELMALDLDRGIAGRARLGDVP